MAALGRFGRLVEAFKSGEEEAAIINTSAIADTLHSEDFLEVEDLSEGLKKGCRGPAALLLRLAISFRLSAFFRVTSLHLPTDFISASRTLAYFDESLEPLDGLGAR